MLLPVTCRFLSTLVKTLFSYTRKHKVPLYLSLLVHLAVRAVLPGYVLYVVKRKGSDAVQALSICEFSGKV